MKRMEAFCDSGHRWCFNKKIGSEGRYSHSKKKEKNKVKFFWVLLEKKFSSGHGCKKFVWTFENAK